MNDLVVREQALMTELGATNAMRAYLRSGDLSTIPEAEKDKVLIKMCAHYDLDPILRPFILLKLNGKEVWYPTKSATDQVAAKFNLTREIVDIKENVERGVLECRVKITQEGSGRVETCIAAISITEFVRDASGKVTQKLLSGEAYANALMKLESKAKRRATLGWLGISEGVEKDEVEKEAVVVEKKTLEIEENPMDLTINVETEPKKNGNKRTRAEIETKVLAKKEPESERLHLAEQIENVNKLNQKVEATPEKKEEIKKGAVEIMQKKEPAKEQAQIVEAVESQGETPMLPDYTTYDRTNDSHKEKMMKVLIALGIEFKTKAEIELAAKVSAACHNTAPMFLGQEFKERVFVKHVSEEINKTKNPVAIPF